MGPWARALGPGLHAAADGRSAGYSGYLRPHGGQQCSTACNKTLNKIMKELNLYCPYLLHCVKIGNTIKYSKNTIWGILRDAQKNTQKILPGRANSPKTYSKNTPRSIFRVLFE